MRGNEILTSIKGHKFVTNLRKMAGKNPNLDIFNISMHIQNLMKFCPFALKMLSGNEILTPIKGHNSDTNLQKPTGNNLNLDLVNINAYTKFGQILSILSKDIERKRKPDINEGA